VTSTFVALLRGVNLGKRRMKMDALRAAFRKLDSVQDPRTYLQSGNVVFGTSERSRDKLIRQIEAAIQDDFGFHSDVVLRTIEEMRQVVAANPFADRQGIEPAKLAVVFLGTTPPANALQGMAADPEELVLIGSELFIYYPNGMGRSKLNSNAIDKALKTTETARNWNSVTNILAMMDVSTASNVSQAD
jgi:uncharacterized protein (DUF1697 family)